MFGKKKKEEKEIVQNIQDNYEPLQEGKTIESVENYLDGLLNMVLEDHENDSLSDALDYPDPINIQDEEDIVVNNPEEALTEDADDVFDELLQKVDVNEEIDLEEEILEEIEEYIEQTEEEPLEESTTNVDVDELIGGLDEVMSTSPDQDNVFEDLFKEDEFEELDISEGKPLDLEKISDPKSLDDDSVLEKVEQELLKEEPKKDGFFKRLLKKKKKDKNSHPIEDAEDETDYSLQNKRMMEELEEESEEDTNEKKGTNKKKSSKKTQKKEKKLKIKKEKDPELEEKIKISGRAFLLLFTIVLVLIIGVIIGGNILTYKQRINDATNYFVAKDYSSAYEMVSGTNLKETDQEFYMQLRLIMYVHKNYEAYNNFMNVGQENKALHYLVKAVKSYEQYKEKGREYNVLEEMQYSLGLVTDALKSDFGVTEAQAREISIIEDRNIYSERIYKILEER